ncbi:hypothetical protein AcV5_005949 [Taiwanofungus camphoratus]|nr:hypothetical protein AcV5_005949 [Antrodia cinnamomea]KAI0948267.1 hypothetical protein AcV7_009067 [Antrodia cinnamomea]
MADAGSESACCDTAAIHNACHIWNAIIRIWEVILVRDKGGRSTRVVRVLARNVQRIASSNGCRRIYYHIRAATPRVRSGSAPFQMSNTRLLFAAPSPWQPHDHHAVAAPSEEAQHLPRNHHTSRDPRSTLADSRNAT